MDIIYTYNNISFKSYLVYVSETEGLLGARKRKEPEKYQYPDEDGFYPDLRNLVFKERIIKITCFIKANDIVTLIENYNNFTTIIQEVDDLKELNVNFDGHKTLTYKCYVDGISDIRIKIVDGLNVGTFTITFIEP